MGRWNFSGKTECDGLNKIEIWWLRRNGYLCGIKSGGIEWTSWSGKKSSVEIEVSLFGDLRYPEERKMYVDYCFSESDETFDSFRKHIIISYTSTSQSGEKTDVRDKISLGTTKCNYGGVRYWFFCPWCTRRVGVLYSAGIYYRCRHCYNLTYSSKNCGHSITSYEKLYKLREEIKRPYYKGKMTRRYKSYLLKERRNSRITENLLLK